MTHAQLVGRWRRGLLRAPNTADDVTSDVSWIQGPSRYVDLRLPAGLPTVTARSAGDLTLTDLLLLAHRQGFAGTFRLAADVAGWHRAIDLQPPAPTPDVGRITLLPRAAGDLPGTTDLLVETGVHADYVEHWWRVVDDGDPPDLRAGCATGRDEFGRAVVVVRAGRHVALARDRAAPLPAGARDLAEAVRGAADVGTARTLVDCELSWGTVDAAGWHLERSSLPWRTGVTLRPRRVGDRLDLRAATTSAPLDRWTLTDVLGQESLLHRPTAPRTTAPRTTARPPAAPVR